MANFVAPAARECVPRAAVIYAFYGTCCDSSNARRRRCSRRARPAEQGQSAAVGHSVQILGSNSTRRSLAAALHPVNKAVIISQALSPDWCYGWRRSVGLDAYTALLLQRCDVIQTAHATPYKSAPAARRKRPCVQCIAKDVATDGVYAQIKTIRNPSPTPSKAPGPRCSNQKATKVPTKKKITARRNSWNPQQT